MAGQTEAVVTRWGWLVPTEESRYVLRPPSLFDKKESCLKQFAAVKIPPNRLVFVDGTGLKRQFLRMKICGTRSLDTENDICQIWCFFYLLIVLK